MPSDLSSQYLDKHIGLHAPQPLALRWHLAVNTTDPAERAKRLIDVTRLFQRLLWIYADAFARAHRGAPNRETTVEELHRPSDGDWSALLSVLLGQKETVNHTLLEPIVSWWQGHGSGGTKVTKVLAELVMARNVDAHTGALPTTRSVDEYERQLRYLLRSATWLTEFFIFHVEHTSVLGAGLVQGRVRWLMGAAALEVPSYGTGRWRGDLAVGRTYVVTRRPPYQALRVDPLLSLGKELEEDRASLFVLADLKTRTQGHEDLADYSDGRDGAHRPARFWDAQEQAWCPARRDDLETRIGQADPQALVELEQFDLTWPWAGPVAAATDRYVVRDELGHGSIATVYRAYDRQHERDVALKLLDASACAAPEVVAAFKRDIRLLQEINHPNLVRCLGDGEMVLASGQQSYYLVMPLADGSLASRLTSRTLSPARFEQWCVDLLEGLDALHSNLHAHGNLKASNVLIMGSRAVIADAGQTELAVNDAVYARPANDMYSVGRIIHEGLEVLGDRIEQGRRRRLETVARRAMASSSTPPITPLQALEALGRRRVQISGQHGTVHVPVLDHVAIRQVARDQTNQWVGWYKRVAGLEGGGSDVGALQIDQDVLHWLNRDDDTPALLVAGDLGTGRRRVLSQVAAVSVSKRKWSRSTVVLLLSTPAGQARRTLFSSLVSGLGLAGDVGAPTTYNAFLTRWSKTVTGHGEKTPSLVVVVDTVALAIPLEQTLAELNDIVRRTATFNDKHSSIRVRWVVGVEEHLLDGVYHKREWHRESLIPQVAGLGRARSRSGRPGRPWMSVAPYTPREAERLWHALSPEGPPWSTLALTTRDLLCSPELHWLARLDPSVAGDDLWSRWLERIPADLLQASEALANYCLDAGWHDVPMTEALSQLLPYASDTPEHLLSGLARMGILAETPDGSWAWAMLPIAGRIAAHAFLRDCVDLRAGFRRLLGKPQTPLTQHTLAQIAVAKWQQGDIESIAAGIGEMLATGKSPARWEHIIGTVVATVAPSNAVEDQSSFVSRLGNLCAATPNASYANLLKRALVHSTYCRPLKEQGWSSALRVTLHQARVLSDEVLRQRDTDLDVLRQEQRFLEARCRAMTGDGHDRSGFGVQPSPPTSSESRPVVVARDDQEDADVAALADLLRSAHPTALAEHYVRRLAPALRRSTVHSVLVRTGVELGWRLTVLGVLASHPQVEVPSYAVEVSSVEIAAMLLHMAIYLNVTAKLLERSVPDPELLQLLVRLLERALERAGGVMTASEVMRTLNGAEPTHPDAPTPADIGMRFTLVKRFMAEVRQELAPGAEEVHLGLDKDDLAIVLSMIHVACADGVLEKAELDAIREEVLHQGLDLDEVELVKDAIYNQRIEPDQIARYVSGGSSRLAALGAAYGVAHAGSSLGSQERPALRTLAGHFDVDEEAHDRVEHFVARILRRGRWDDKGMWDEIADAVERDPFLVVTAIRQ